MRILRGGGDDAVVLDKSRNLALAGPCVAPTMHTNVMKFLVDKEASKAMHDPPVHVRVILVRLRDDHVEIATNKPRARCHVDRQGKPSSLHPPRGLRRR